MNIWQTLKKEKSPILVLAPMADVTDVAFRYVIAKYGKPDVIWTEFVSADGLVLAPNNNPDEQGFTSQDKLRADLKFSNHEKPIVAQIFGSRAENIKKVSKELVKMGFDGIDINMGCPEKNIVKQKCGSAMIKNPKLAKKIILAAKDGVGYKKSIWSTLYAFFRFCKLDFLANFLIFKIETIIPVSVKTRIGYNHDELETWLPNLLKVNPAVVTIHCRTRQQMSKVPADWTRIKRAVEIRNEFYKKNFLAKHSNKNNRILIFGNGDVKNREEANIRSKETGCDGVMIGRGIFGNPWLFGPVSKKSLSKKQVFEVVLEHTKKFVEELPHKNFAIMKKHYKSYVQDFDDAGQIRLKLMETQTYEDVEKILRNSY